MAESKGSREKIEKAVLELMKETDIPHIKVNDVVKCAGISRATFYRHYDNVDNVVKEMEFQVLEELRDISRYSISSMLDFNNLDKPNEVYLALFKYIDEHRDFFTSMFGPHGDPMFDYKQKQLIREFYGGKIAFEGIECQHLDLYINFALAGHNRLIEYWLTKRSDISYREICVIIQKLMYGIFLN